MSDHDFSAHKKVWDVTRQAYVWVRGGSKKAVGAGKKAANPVKQYIRTMTGANVKNAQKGVQYAHSPKDAYKAAEGVKRANASRERAIRHTKVVAGGTGVAAVGAGGGYYAGSKKDKKFEEQVDALLHHYEDDPQMQEVVIAAANGVQGFEEQAVFFGFAERPELPLDKLSRNIYGKTPVLPLPGQLAVSAHNRRVIKKHRQDVKAWKKQQRAS